jgi:hypothetical protein
MKSPKLVVIIFCVLLSLIACKKDDGPSCVSCESPQTSSFTLCEESDGTASVNGQNTGTSYGIYISDLEATGVNCTGQ